MDTEGNKQLANKLDAKLIAVLRDTNEAMRLAVIVEVASGRPTIEFALQERGNQTILRPKAISRSSDAHAAFESAVEYFDSQRWSGNKPVYIRGANAVSIDVNRDELCEIAAQDFVKKISLNELHMP